MISYPDKPWNDGQTFSVTQKDGTYVVGTYNESKNAWSFTRVIQPPVEVPPDPNS